jgi:hypothetical protein
MGASQSVVSGHHAHPEGRQHRLKRVSSNEVREPCMMCSKPVELGVGEVAYRCRYAGCGFVLHDACYHLPKKMKHFAHSGSGHHLTLSDGHQLPAGAGRRSCNICAVGIDVGGGGGPSSFVYACIKCHSFYAHPRCCRLPQTMHNRALHQHALTLLPPPQPHGKGHGGRRGRSCLNVAGNCRNAKRLDSDAWSYQCNQCDVEVCLECQLPDGRPAPVEPKNGCSNVVETLGAVGQQLATATGTALRALCCAWLGTPMHTATPAS